MIALAFAIVAGICVSRGYFGCATTFGLLSLMFDGGERTEGLIKAMWRMK